MIPRDEVFYYYEPYDAICLNNTSGNQLAQGLGTYLTIHEDVGSFYDGGENLLNTHGLKELLEACDCFCIYCGYNTYRAKELLRSLAMKQWV